MNFKKCLPLVFLSTGIVAQAKEQAQPNIVIMFVDDLGWADLGYQNPEFETPNINKLKEKSLYFSRAYVPTATSSPSRAALMTGKESLRVGFVRHIYDEAEETEFQTFANDPRQMRSRGYLPLSEVTYAERLKEEGYYTCHVGKWHLGYEDYYPEKQGFDESRGLAKYGHPKNYYFPFFEAGNPYPDNKEGDYLTELVTESTTSFIKDYDKDQPFLLNTWFYTVHGPHFGRKDLVEKYKKMGYTTKLANYHAMVSSLDTAVGEILSALEEKGIADETVILFSSDQGGFFKNGHLAGGKLGGNTLGEGGTRVPLLAYIPGAEAMGQTYEEPVQTIDIYPTLIELATGKRCKDKQINGVSLMPTFEGKKLKSRDLFLHRSYEDQHCAIIRDDWKLVKYTSGKLELFNLGSDESETTNLVDVHPKIAKNMLKRLNAWLEDATPKELLSENY